MRGLPAARCNLYGGWKLADDGESEGGELGSMEAHITYARTQYMLHSFGGGYPVLQVY